MMKKKIKTTFVLIFLCLNMVTYGQSNKPLTYEDIRMGIANYLVKIDYFENIEKYYDNPKAFHIKGFFNEIPDKEFINDGIYRFSSRSTHSIPWLIIVEENHYKILDLRSEKELFISLTDILDFSKNKNYCKEIVMKYIATSLGWYSQIQLSKGQTNCYLFQNDKSSSSELSIMKLKTELFEFLNNENIFEEEDLYILFLDKIDEFNLSITIDYMDDEGSEIFDKGYYHFTAIDIEQKNAANYYLLLGDKDFELVTMKGNEYLNQEFFSLLSFGLKQKFCIEKIKYILSNYLKEKWPSESCLDSVKNKLP